MIASILLYNVLMVLVDLGALRVLRSRRSWGSRGALLAGIATMPVVLAVVLGLRGGGFAVFALLAFGVFVHTVVVLVGGAIVLWSEKRWVAIGYAAAASVLVAVGVDAFLIEPHGLEVSRIRLPSKKVEKPVRIVVLADLQTDAIGDYERDVFCRVLEEQPDLILLAGDYIQARGAARTEAYERLNRLLRELRMPGPGQVFAVRGNAEADDWTEMFRGTGIVTVESRISFAVAGIELTCLERWDSFHRGLNLRSPDPKRFHLVLGHSPDYALGRVEADLLVAGHTHGGQVRLPWVGPLITLARVPRSWSAGLSDLPSGAKLLVSRGVGMERGDAPRMRFLCRPELVVIELVPE